MEISDHIIEEAKKILSQEDTSLPIQLATAKEFYLAASGDETILAFGSFFDNGIEYKIGVKKNQ